ncbi:focadhesin isoform X1 [Strongylocentrotus purpuratus]|uniref:Focadhesin n=1 Tax=Strongylocentrotus purpuratus TaxID=7668 RepID=A0A7M7N7V5_STRPU|nr:focadhesin isoform X1 [Strongylocentrotus purpuratus]XP_030832482.1 focadhesin isoform X1 [Strongylocentrotus purpuratus]
MEELTQKLNFDAIGIQCQTVKRICQSIKERRAHLIGDEPISAATRKIEKLELLWSKCRDGSPRQSSLCSHALIELWEDGVLQQDYILQEFINLVPTARTVKPCVDAVGKLLLMLVKKSLFGVMGSGDEVVPENRCYFYMRTRPHPFISMYKSRPDCWSSILETVSSLLSQDNDRLQTEVLHILKSFIKYALLDPLIDPKQGSLRVLLAESLAQACRPRLIPQSSPQAKEVLPLFLGEVVKFLLECMPCLPTSTCDAVTEAAHLATVTMDIISGYAPSIDVNLVGQSIYYCLSLGHQLEELGMDMSPVLRLLAGMNPGHMKFQDVAIIAMIANLLLIGSIQEQNFILQFALKFFGSPAGPTRSRTKKLLVWSLIQVLDHLLGRSTIELKSLEVSVRKENCEMALKLFHDITAIRLTPLVEGSGDVPDKIVHFHGVHPWHNTMSVFQETAVTVLSNVNTAQNWLCCQKAKVHAGIGDTDMEETIQLTVAILFSFGHQLAHLCIDVLVDVGNVAPAKAYSMVPLFMYTLRKIRVPAMSTYLIKALPRLVGHRYLISPVFKLVLNSNLDAMSLKLVTDLWKKQDRIFPELQMKLAECEKSIGHLNPHTGLDDMLLEIAICVCEVCTHRPVQHGADMVRTLSMVLKKATGPRGVPATCYALDALISITKAEDVVDIITAYKGLAGQFQAEERPMVIAKWCEFLGLVPELHVDSKKYEGFTRAVINQLWLYTAHPDHRVVSESLSALAAFKICSFEIRHLPREATKDVQTKRAQDRKRRADARTSRGEEEEEDEEEEEEDLSIPGSCFINLLPCVNQEATSGKGELLHSFLCDELVELPRRYYSQTSPRQAATESNVSKQVSGIPSVISLKNLNNKQPGHRPSYAAGLLFSFKPGSKSSRDPKKARKNKTALSQVCLDELTLLLNEVPVSSPDWFYIMQLPSAWASFMSTALQAVIEGRRSEVEHEACRGRDGPDEEKQKEGLASAWLWARDRLTEQLRTTVLKNSGARGNAILALGGLAHAVSAYVVQLGEEATLSQRSASQYEGHKSWITRVVDSFQVAMDSIHTAQSVFKFCQHHSRDHSQATGEQVHSCAALALPLLASHIMTMPTNAISQVIDRMMSLSSAQPSSVPIHHGLGVGMLLARLCVEHFTDMTGTEGDNVLSRYFDKLENTVLTQNNNPQGHVIGCTLGLGVALSGLTHESTTHAKVHVLKVRGDLLSKIESLGNSASCLTEAQVLCVALVTAACYQVNYITSQEALHTAKMLQTMAQNNLKCIPLAVGTGLLMHSLTRIGHQEVIPLYNNQQAELLRLLTDKDSSIDLIKSSVAGLVALLVGPGHLVQSERRPGPEHRGLSSAVKMLCQLLSDTSDLRLQHSLPWLLGYLYMGSTDVTEARSSVPSNYNNLEESSLLRAAVDMLIAAGRLGSEVVPSRHVLTVLKVLHECSESCKKALPPVNWAVVLNPIMRNNSYANGAIYYECMKLAVGQCAVVRSAALQSNASFVASWLSPSVYLTIKESCEKHLFQSLHILVGCIPLEILKAFLSGQLVGLFQHSNTHFTHCITALHGLNLAAQVPDPAHGVVNLLNETARKIFASLPFDKEYDCLLHAHFAEFIKYLPMEFLEEVTQMKDHLLKPSFIRGYLVKQGLQPVQWLKDCVDEAMNVGSESDQSVILWFLMIALGQTPSQLPVQEREMWLQQLMNHLKTIAFGRESTPSSSTREPHQRINFLLEVFAISIVTWSSPEFTHICGPHPHHYVYGTSQGTGQLAAGIEGGEEELSSTESCESTPDWLQQVNENSPLGCGEYGRQTVQRVKGFLPGALCRLVSKAPWDGMRGKIIEWLINMSIDSKNELVTEPMRRELKGCLYALRHYNEFRANSQWMKIFDK